MRRPFLILLIIVIAAAALRLVALETRPPHHDEGVNGWFAEEVAHRGYYEYDPGNFHGPSYFYLLGATRAALGYGLWQLRVPGALLGVALCVAPLLARRRLGWGRALAACGLLAASPTLVYYARYAIHETLLVALELVVAFAVLRWSDHGRARWLVLAAGALAGMVATKETTVLFVAAAGVWLAVEVAVESWRARGMRVLGHPPRWSARAGLAVLAAVAVMATVHVTLYTGAFQQPGRTTEQLASSVRAYTLWHDTGTGASGHEKAWCYYLHHGVRYELALHALAAIGLCAGFRERWVRGPGLVGFGLAAGYSLIDYKMPWLPMSWLVLLAVPAAHGLGVLGGALRDQVWHRLGPRAALALALVPMLAIALRVSLVRPADPGEDLAYVHTAPDFARWAPLVHDAAAVVGRRNITIAVEHPVSWPLPWVFLRYPRARFGVARGEDILLIDVERAAAAEKKLTERYLRRRHELRAASAPFYLYLRASAFAPLVAARGERGFELVGPAPGELQASPGTDGAPAAAPAAARAEHGVQSRRGMHVTPTEIPALSVIIPAYNEARRITPTLRRVTSYLDARAASYEVIVVDDGSHDQTRALVTAFAAEHARVRLVLMPQNGGKGAAVRAGVLRASGAQVLFTDADLSTPIEEVERLAAALGAGADVAVGSRAAPGDVERRQPFLRRVQGRVFHALTRLMGFRAVAALRDTQCGFKLFRGGAARALFGELTLTGFAFDVELLELAHGRFTIAEVPVAWAHADGSKVRPGVDALKMMRDLASLRWSWIRRGRPVRALPAGEGVG